MSLQSPKNKKVHHILKKSQEQLTRFKEDGSQYNIWPYPAIPADGSEQHLKEIFESDSDNQLDERKLSLSFVNETEQRIKEKGFASYGDYDDEDDEMHIRMAISKQNHETKKFFG